MTRDAYYLTGGSHVLVSGPTGAGPQYGGKSATANWWQDSLVSKGWKDVAVSIDAGNAGYEGARVDSLRALGEAYRDGERQFVWPDGDRVDDVVRVVDELPGDAVMVFDEAWSYRETDGLIDVVRNLGNQAEPITGIVVSQRAWDLPDAVRNSTPVKVWVGPLTTEGRQYFTASGMQSVADALDGRMDPYHWAVTDGGELQAIHEPVPERYA